MQSFHPHTNKPLYLNLALLVIIVITLILSPHLPKSAWIFIVVLASVTFLTRFFSGKVIEIRLDNELTVVYRTYLKTTKTQSYPLQQIEFTYKKQPKSPRSGTKNVCTLYSNDQKIATLTPGEDGWHDDEIRKLLYALIDLKIKKKFVGYGLKDVEI